MWAFCQLSVSSPAALSRARARPGPGRPRARARAPAPAARPRSPSGSSTVRARRSERVRRLSCSIALSILGAPPALPQPRRPPPRRAPYIPPRPVCGRRGRPAPGAAGTARGRVLRPGLRGCPTARRGNTRGRRLPSSSGRAGSSLPGARPCGKRSSEPPGGSRGWGRASRERRRAGAHPGSPRGFQGAAPPAARVLHGCARGASLAVCHSPYSRLGICTAVPKVKTTVPIWVRLFFRYINCCNIILVSYTAAPTQS